MTNDFTKAMAFRHACKVFDETRTVSEEEIRYILEAGRESPSSFGMEPWKFLVITDEKLKAQLRPVCWNQVQITSCSHLVVILAAIESVKVESGIPKARFMRRNMPQETLEFYMKLYADHLKQTLSSDAAIFSWTARQTYIAAANMMTAAAFVGIDSCPIEGFEQAEVERILELDITQYRVALIVPFGYRVNSQPSQVRLPFDDVVTFI